MKTNAIDEGLAEMVLARLGLTSRPHPTLAGLSTVYEAWCRAVPFDNVRKLIHLGQGRTEVFPGDTPRDFMEAWLRYGSGGTCWAGNGALAALLQALGFNASRGIGTMMVAPNLPPNHGTVVVTIDGQPMLVDASILHVEPLQLDVESETTVTHPAWGVKCSQRDGKWHVLWRSVHQAEPFECRIDRLMSDATEFSDFHERTRPWSPFNYNVYARKVKGDTLIGVSNSERVVIDGTGTRRTSQLSNDEKRSFLVEEIGISDELVSQLPPDVPTPPPPKP